METSSPILLLAALVPALAHAQAGRIEQVQVYPGDASVERLLAVKAGQQPGIVAWQFELAPGQNQRLAADHLIIFPKDARIGGLR